jgi:hypothetical protein
MVKEGAMKYILDGPFKTKNQRAAWVEYTMVSLLLAFVLLVLVLGGVSWYKACTVSIEEPGWISKQELTRLQRYHGTNALKVTETAVYIYRDGKWLQVVGRRYDEKVD